MPKISIIICAYNAADTLMRAARSVLNQSFRDIELILVNDGSKDATLSIVTRLAMTDRRVKVLNLENGGLAKARNTGLKYATGEYVSFCDADDYIDDGAFETMFFAAEKENADMLICGYFHETVVKNGVNTTAIASKEAVYNSKAELYRDFVELKSKYLIDTVCNKLLRRSIITQNGLKFPEGELFEDTAFVLEYLEITGKIAVISDCFYHYIQYPKKGITRQYNSKKLAFLTDRYHRLLSFCEGGGDNLLKFCHLYNVRNVYSCLSGAYGTDMPKKSRNKLIKETALNQSFLECAKAADGKGLSNRVTLLVARSGCLWLNRVYCKCIYLAKEKAAVLFTKLK